MTIAEEDRQQLAAYAAALPSDEPPADEAGASE